MPPNPPTLPPKKDVLLALLERTSVFIHLDPRREGVRVPDWFKKQPQLILQVGLNLPVPIRDLQVDDQAVSCTLSFSRTPHLCYMPWSAIYAIVGEDGRGMVWPDDVPREVAAQQAEQLKAQKKKRDRPKLRAIGSETEAEADATDMQMAAGGTATARADSASTTPGPAAPEPNLDSDSSATADKAADEGPKRRLPPYLRVVK